MLHQQKILIVDDQPTNIELLHELFQEEYQVYFATCGADALVSAQSQLPDIILLDVMMPGMDGREVCRRLKSIPETRNIPVIFITAMREDLDEALGLELGAVDYVTKPINPLVVKLRVKNQLELKQHRDRLEELVVLRTAELESARKLAEAGNRAKHEFLMVVSHELRNPLSSIIGFSDLMVSTEKDDGVRDHAQRILNAGNVMLELVNDILDLTRIEPETGYQEQSLIFYLPELLEEALVTVEKIACVKKLSPMFFMDDSVPKFVQGDRKRLLQVLRHLLTNAVKFTLNGTIRLDVSLSPNADVPHLLLFRVTDTGIGIAPEKREVIFQHFTQLASPNTRSEGGLGLGLTICKRFVDVLGGSLWVESELGQGSVFSFTAILPEAIG